MNKRGKVGKFKSTSTICITSVVFLSLIGVCYGMLTGGLNVNVNLATGGTDTQAVVDNMEFGNLIIDISEEEQLVRLHGEIYRDFKEDINIMVKNTGTIPLVLNKIEEIAASDIVELGQKGRERRGLFSLLGDDDVIDNFNLSISLPEDNENAAGFRTCSDMRMFQGGDGIQGEINALRGEIRELEAEISRLNVIEHYDFKYILHFIQGI